jgi:hypothetical protein
VTSNFVPLTSSAILTNSFHVILSPMIVEILFHGFESRTSSATYFDTSDVWVKTIDSSPVPGIAAALPWISMTRGRGVRYDLTFGAT